MSTDAAPPLEILGSPGLPSWLAKERVSLAFTSYRSGKVFLVGLQPDGRLSIFERTFARCMGMWTDGQTLWVASLFEIWRFENMLPPGRRHQGYDRCYAPQVGYVTGDLNVHDIAVDRRGRLIFVNTMFNCLAAVSDTHSFAPLWKPPFIASLVAEDHCHLNGMALEDGTPRYASMFARIDEPQGWRRHRLNGGCVIDLHTNQFVVEGLAMPHSPRLYRGRLWLLHSGVGYFGYVDRERKTFVPVTFCPGYVRGLAFTGDYAVVGVSKGREQNMFEELPLHANLRVLDREPHCGLAIVDLRTGDIVHTLWIEGVVTQLYDVVVLPGVVRPMALGFKTEEIQHMVSLGDPAPLR